VLDDVNQEAVQSTQYRHTSACSDYHSELVQIDLCPPPL